MHSERLERLSFDVIGAAIEVHRSLGPGHLEGIYDRAMRVELKHRNIPFETQFPIDVRHRGVRVGTSRIDLLVGGEIVLELKAVEHVTDVHRNQLSWYIYLGAFPIGLLINFRNALLKDGITRFDFDG